MKNFLSAEEDLRERTLASFTGTIARILYIASLTDQAGKLSHAGLERTYGSEVAKAALDDAFRSLCLELLRFPLGELLGAVHAVGCTTNQLVDLKELWQREARGVSLALYTHLSYVIGALTLALEDQSANQAA